jgi:hypothetical protein
MQCTWKKEEEINHAQKTGLNATWPKSGGDEMHVNKEGRWLLEKERRKMTHIFHLPVVEKLW